MFLFSRESLAECPRVAMLKNGAAGVVFGAHGSNVEVVDVVHLGGWGMAAGVGADRLCFEHGFALGAPLPVLPLASVRIGGSRGPLRVGGSSVSETWLSRLLERRERLPACLADCGGGLGLRPNRQ